MPNKTRPCPECGVNGRTRHIPSCQTGQARSAASRKAHAARQAKINKPTTWHGTRLPSQPTKTSHRIPVTQSFVQPSPAAVQPVNHIALLIDMSGSMSSVYDLAVQSINNQIDEIKRQSQANNQASYLSLYSFSDSVFTVFRNQFIHAVNPVTLSQLRRGGQTPLYDAIGNAIFDLHSMPIQADADVSFLVVTVTDGQENYSKRWSADTLAEKIKAFQATDRWTFTFSGPRGSASQIQRVLGFHVGNVMEWENTRQGTQVMSANLSQGFESYYGSRTRGLTSTKAFFTPDMTQVTQRDLAKLQDVKDQFKVLPVDNSTPDGREWEIRPFVEDRLAKNATLRRQAGDVYEVGRAYYELTKPEDVQPHKDILIMNRTTGAIFGGNEARGAIGMPTNCDVKVKPGNVANYRLFIKSTSVNRKLVRGTAVLYRVR